MNVILLVLLVIEALLLVDAIRRHQEAIAVTIIMAYIIFCQFVSHVVVRPESDYAAMLGRLGMSYSDNERGVWVYFLVFLTTYLASIVPASGPQLSGTSTLQERTETRKSLVIWIAIVMVNSVVFLHLACIDFDTLWSSSQYLEIGGIGGLRVKHPLAYAVHRGYFVASMLAAAAIGFEYSQRHYRDMVLWCLPFTWGLVIALAESSRRAAVLVALVATVGAFAGQRKHRYGTSILLAAVSFFLCCAALGGRRRGRFGIGAIPTMIWSTVNNLFDYTAFTLGNICEGVFVTGRAIDMHVSFSRRYEMLSFSCLPSFIDGFDKINSSDQVRIHQFVPISAIGELVHFGMPSLCAVLIIYFIAMRQNVILAKVTRSRSAPVFTALIFAIFVQALAYPLRNVFRQLLFVVVAQAIAVFLARFGCTLRTRSGKGLVLALYSKGS